MLDDLRVPRDDPRAPPGHVPPLRGREDLDPDVLRAGGLEEARRAVAVEADLRVRVVVDDGQVVPARELDCALEIARLHDRARRIVRVVQEQEVRAGRDVVRHGVEVG